MQDLERLVVPPTLQDLRQKSLDAPAVAVHRRVEEDESRLFDGSRDSCHIRHLQTI
jgi:hypothetical protein